MFKVNGILLPDPEKIRLREIAEAEKALDMGFDERGMAGKLAILLFIAMRRQDATKPIPLLADEVLNADIGTVEEVEEASPPALAAVDGDGKGHESQQTSGVPLSEASV